MREDGLQLDKLLLVTDTAYLPIGEGPAESPRETGLGASTAQITRTIAYTYDGVYRLTEANYGTTSTNLLLAQDAYFAYEYDLVGNQTQITEQLDETIITTYTYDAANRLTTAQSDHDGVTWHYSHDANSNLVRQTPGGTTPAEGETRYSYDAANRLVKVELLTDGSYTLLSKAEYNGVGERMSLTTYALGSSETVQFVTAEGQLLVNDVAGSPTLYLYGAGQFAEYSSSGWQYSLRDSNTSVRQTVDDSGQVVSARTYKPFGALLQEEGTYESAFGFLGAQVDRVSGLLYVNGRYYDPVTGRYLTPDHGQANPYAPVQYPGMWLLLPLVGIVFAWKGRKGGPWRMLVLVVVIGVSGLLVSCGSTERRFGVGEPNFDPLPSPPNTPIGNIEFSEDDAIGQQFGVEVRRTTNPDLDGKTTFNDREWNLIRKTLFDYEQKILSRKSFKKNFGHVLIRISKRWTPGRGFNALGVQGTHIVQNSGHYDVIHREIVLPPNLSQSVDISTDPYNDGRHVFVGSDGNTMPAFDPFESDPRHGLMFKDAKNSGVFTTQDITFQWVLAHELTHALSIGNHDILQSFINEFWREDVSCMQIADRNVNRHPDEVLADFMASYLYAQPLLENQKGHVENWIKTDLFSLLK